jgi:hypothetical protein
MIPPTHGALWRSFATFFNAGRVLSRFNGQLGCGLPGYAWRALLVKINLVEALASGEGIVMPRGSYLAIVLCWLLVSGALCLSSTTPVEARSKSHKSSHVSKHKSKNAKKSKRSRKSAPAEKQVAMPTPHTPLDKGDCIAAAQAFYKKATSLYKRTSIPDEFERVTSKLDEFCGEEEFEKARVSIDWMSTCLKTYAEDRSHFCTRSTSYYCAIDPQSEGCRQHQSKLE